jgi:hypothetical protein
MNHARLHHSRLPIRAFATHGRCFLPRYMGHESATLMPAAHQMHTVSRCLDSPQAAPKTKDTPAAAQQADDTSTIGRQSLDRTVLLWFWVRYSVPNRYVSRLFGLHLCSPCTYNQMARQQLTQPASTLDCTPLTFVHCRTYTPVPIPLHTHHALHHMHHTQRKNIQRTPSQKTQRPATHTLPHPVSTPHECCTV